MMCDRLEREDLLGYLGERMDPHVDACGDCQTRRIEYAILVAALARESDRPTPLAWKERILARLRRKQAARRRRAAMALCTATAAVAALILVATLRPGESRRGEATLSVRVEGGATTWRGPGHLGDRLQISATPGSARHGELRVYRDARPVTRCPGAAATACRVRDGRVELVWTLTTTGEYRIIWLVSSAPIPQPTGGHLDADLRAADEAGARLAREWPILRVH